MSERIGYVGKVDGKHKVFYDGMIYFTEINGKAFAINWEEIAKKRKSNLI